MENKIELKDVEAFVEDAKTIENEIIKKLESYGLTYDPTLEVGELTACALWFCEHEYESHLAIQSRTKDKRNFLERVKINFISQFVTLPIFGLASRRVFKFKNSCYQ